MTGAAAERRRSVFVDTHALVAAVVRKDVHHREVLELFARHAAENTPVVTSDWVLAEFLSICAETALRRASCDVIAVLRSSPLTSIVPADRKTWNEAYDLFSGRLDKEWSLVDCTSMVLCQRFGIRRVMTHDHHFAQAGFEVLID